MQPHARILRATLRAIVIDGNDKASTHKVRLAKDAITHKCDRTAQERENQKLAHQCLPDHAKRHRTQTKQERNEQTKHVR